MKKGLLAAIIASLLLIGVFGIAPTFAQVNQDPIKTTTAPVTSDTAAATQEDCTFY